MDIVEKIKSKNWNGSFESILQQLFQLSLHLSAINSYWKKRDILKNILAYFANE